MIPAALARKDAKPSMAYYVVYLGFFIVATAASLFAMRHFEEHTSEHARSWREAAAANATFNDDFNLDYSSAAIQLAAAKSASSPILVSTPALLVGLFFLFTVHRDAGIVLFASSSFLAGAFFFAAIRAIASEQSFYAMTLFSMAAVMVPLGQYGLGFNSSRQKLKSYGPFSDFASIL